MGLKYSPFENSHIGVTSWPPGVSAKLMAASQSASSWKRHHAAVNNFRKFCIEKNCNLSFPVTVTTLRSYTNWALSEKKLTANSVKVYLSDLKLAHLNQGWDVSVFSDHFVKAMINGSANMAIYTSISKKNNLAFSFPLLKILGHEIAISNWSIANKRVFWTASCVAFFGSFRMGEILTEKEGVFTIENLTWNKITLKIDHATIEISTPKSGFRKKGDFIDLFHLEDEGCCAVCCLKGLKSANEKTINENLPVFTFDSGKFLTTKLFTKTVQQLLEPHLGSHAKLLTGHSFRAGIPSMIANHTHLLSDDDIKKWGRWSSSSYQAYVRLKMSARREIFNKIASALK